MIKEQIEKIIGGENLTFNDAHSTMIKVMDGHVNTSQIAALLVALKSKGETAQEIAGFARAMRDKSVKLPVSENNAVDLCGTGGDGSGTFNISTAAAFVVTAAGVPVAKHGNRSVSSKSGSADVLEHLGIKIDLTPETSGQALKEVGFTFLFAPAYHPAMKNVAPVRKELGMKTIFNILGPLTNPAGTKRQMIGTFNLQVAALMADAAVYLDMERVCFVSTDDEFDEVSLSAPASVIDYKNGMETRAYQLTPADFGLKPADRSSLAGGTAQDNAQIIENLFKKPQPGPVLDVTVANAAMALSAAGFDQDLKVCVGAAKEAITSGKSYRILNKMREFSNDHS